jgi:hypothetical protein
MREIESFALHSSPIIISNDKREYSHFYSSPNSYKLINIFTVGEPQRPPSMPFKLFYRNGQMLKHFRYRTQEHTILYV